MLVYRIENKKRQGPYVKSNNTLCEHSHKVFDSKQPPPRNDIKLKGALLKKEGTEDIPIKYRFGFCSVEQARKWVYKRSWCLSLRKGGFKLVAFEVPDEFCLVGDSQLMYDCKRVKTSTKVEHCIMKNLWKG